MNYSKIMDYIRGKWILLTSKNLISNNKRVFWGKNSSVEIGTGAKLEFKGKLTLRKRCSIYVRENAHVCIGENVFFNNGCEIACRQGISIGNNVQCGQNVIIIDHDHDYSCDKGIIEGKFECMEICIGDNVWIGANSVILRGTNIGANCVIGAGSVIKGNYSKNTLIVQKRNELIKEI